jgi:hypothetical protein
MYGLRHVSDPRYALKTPWRIQSNCPVFKKLCNLCDGSYSHKPTEGKSAVASGMYTARLANTLSRLLAFPLAKTTRTIREAHPTLGVGARPRPRPAAPAALAAPAPADPAAAPAAPLSPEEFREQRALLSGVRQMHINLGHPPNSALARAIRVTGESKSGRRDGPGSRVCD